MIWLDFIGLIFLVWLIQLVAKPSINKQSSISNQPKLSEEQLKVLNLLEQTKDHIFITGKAGSGKSTVLKQFIRQTNQKVVVTAPTGIAALNVGGQTIHSLLDIKPGIKASEARLSKSTINLLANIDILIIDEISMVRADLIDLIDWSLCQARRNQMAFGGVRLIMFGDLYQLPPIVNDPNLGKYLYKKYGGIYFFDAKVWRKTKLNTYELSQVYRQSNTDFQAILNEVRDGQLSRLSLTKLNQRVLTPSQDKTVITLSSTNKLVNEINSSKLQTLPGKQYSFKAVNYDADTTLPVEPILKLKVGAQVVFTKNDPAGRWVNGSVGIVKSLSTHHIRVKTGHRTYTIEPVTYSSVRYWYNLKKNQLEEKPTHQIVQYPIKLAWAVTIHKSQGQTYDNCAIDLREGVFASGQAYVALSRCRSLDGLYLLSPVLPSDIIVDPKIISFMAKVKKPT